MRALVSTGTVLPALPAFAGADERAAVDVGCCKEAQRKLLLRPTECRRLRGRRRPLVDCFVILLIIDVMIRLVFMLCVSPFDKFSVVNKL